MAFSPVIVPSFIKEIAWQWNPIDQGRVSGVFALLTDDDWRIEHRVDWVLNEKQQNELGLEGETVWAVAQAGVTVAFIETNDRQVKVVYINLRSRMHPGW